MAFLTLTSFGGSWARRAMCLAGTVTTLAAVQVAGMASPAHAGCTESSEYTSTSREHSNPFNASIDCGGVWALYTSSQGPDYIRGVYFKDGVWEQSTYGWQWVTQTPGDDKIIGNTVNGRRVKGIAQSTTFYVRYRY